MKNLKKALKITGITLLALTGILFAAPFLFKGKILSFAKEQINKNINAKADFSDVSISFFRHFPRVAIGLDNLHIVGTEEFSKDTLISAKQIDVAVNIMSVIMGDNMKIYSLTIDEPRIHAIVNKEGHANWDIAKADTSNTAPAEAEKPFQLNLQKYSIRNGYIKYVDEPANMSSEIVNLNHSGSGDFTSDVFTLATETKADAVTFVYAGIPYLAGTKTSITSDISIDNTTSKYSFKTDEIAVNDLKLATEGFFQLVNDSTYNMDFKFSAPSTEFKSILSLVPAVYQTDFASIKTSGKAIFDGFVKGTYSSTKIPAYNINLNIQDGFFQYPDLPKPVKNINLLVKVNNPDGITDNTVVDIPKGHIEFGSDPFDFHLLLKKPVSEQYIDAGAKGKLDLAGITQFVKLEPGTKLAGLINADIQAKGNLAVVTQQKPGEFSAKGFVDVNNLYYGSKAFPQPIQNSSAKIIIDNPDGVADHTTVNIPAAHVEVGKDAADLTLNLETPATDPAFDGTAKGSFDLANVKQFYAFEPGTTLAGLVKADVSFKGKKSFIDKSQYEAIQTGGTVQANNVTYKSKEYPDGVVIKNSLFTFTPKNIAVNTIAGSFMQTNFSANGSFDNLVGYAMKDEPLAGVLNVTADKLDLNKWMGTTSGTDTATTTSAPFSVPKNINFTLNTKVDQVKYDKVDYNNITGALQIKDETVYLKDVQMQALDGSIGLGGSYSTLASKTKPDISLSYDVQNLDVQKTFYAFNTVQKLMPIGKFIAGKLTSKMTMKGKLGEDMMPDMSTLSGAGTLFLLQGFLSKFQPLEKMASTLNISELQQMAIKDIKNYFEFANGKVLIKPFTVKLKDIDMEIGGVHGLDQSIDYMINLKVPRSKFGEKGNQLVNNMVTQVNNKGIPMKLSDVINLHVKMGGSITSPSLQTDLKQSAGNLTEDLKQQATDFAKAKIDSTTSVVKSAVKDSVESAKKQLKQGLEDELKKQLTGKKDSTSTGSGTADTKKNLEETGKGLIKKFNPFGKKKDTTRSN